MKRKKKRKKMKMIRKKKFDLIFFKRVFVQLIGAIQLVRLFPFMNA